MWTFVTAYAVVALALGGYLSFLWLTARSLERRRLALAAQELASRRARWLAGRV
jgi:hypothetical protein